MQTGSRKRPRAEGKDNEAAPARVGTRPVPSAAAVKPEEAAPAAVSLKPAHVLSLDPAPTFAMDGKLQLQPGQVVLDGWVYTRQPLSASSVPPDTILDASGRVYKKATIARPNFARVFGSAYEPTLAPLQTDVKRQQRRKELESVLQPGTSVLLPDTGEAVVIASTDVDVRFYVLHDKQVRVIPYDSLLDKDCQVLCAAADQLRLGPFRVTLTFPSPHKDEDEVCPPELKPANTHFQQCGQMRVSYEPQMTDDLRRQLMRGLLQGAMNSYGGWQNRLEQVVTHTDTDTDTDRKDAFRKDRRIRECLSAGYLPVARTVEEVDIRNKTITVQLDLCILVKHGPVDVPDVLMATYQGSDALEYPTPSLVDTVKDLLRVESERRDVTSAAKLVAKTHKETRRLYYVKITSTLYAGPPFRSTVNAGGFVTTALARFDLIKEALRWCAKDVDADADAKEKEKEGKVTPSTLVLTTKQGASEWLFTWKENGKTPKRLIEFYERKRRPRDYKREELEASQLVVAPFSMLHAGDEGKLLREMHWRRILLDVPGTAFELDKKDVVVLPELRADNIWIVGYEPRFAQGWRTPASEVAKSYAKGLEGENLLAWLSVLHEPFSAKSTVQTHSGVNNTLVRDLVRCCEVQVGEDVPLEVKHEAAQELLSVEYEAEDADRCSLYDNAATLVKSCAAVVLGAAGMASDPPHHLKTPAKRARILRQWLLLLSQLPYVTPSEPFEDGDDPRRKCVECLLSAYLPGAYEHKGYPCLDSCESAVKAERKKQNKKKPQAKTKTKTKIKTKPKVQGKTEANTKKSAATDAPRAHGLDLALDADADAEEKKAKQGEENLHLAPKIRRLMRLVATRDKELVVACSQFVACLKAIETACTEAHVSCVTFLPSSAMLTVASMAEKLRLCQETRVVLVELRVAQELRLPRTAGTLVFMDPSLEHGTMEDKLVASFQANHVYYLIQSGTVDESIAAIRELSDETYTYRPQLWCEPERRDDKTLAKLLLRRPLRRDPDADSDADAHGEADTDAAGEKQETGMEEGED